MKKLLTTTLIVLSVAPALAEGPGYDAPPVNFGQFDRPPQRPHHWGPPHRYAAPGYGSPHSYYDGYGTPVDAYGNPIHHRRRWR
jgi:hypothetical protein